MAHSKRIRNYWSLVVIEVLLFIAAVVSAYLSGEKRWSWFVVVSVVAIVLYVIVKVVEGVPELRELMARDDMASKIANAAVKYGVCRYFNMQSAKEQTLRNETTQKAITEAQSLWLCANSGASYLDPAIYRHWPFVQDRLNEGVEFRVVLLDPFSTEKGFRNQLNVEGERDDSKINLPNLVRLHNSHPSLEIRFARYGMHATIFATEKSLFFDPYHVGIIGNRIENRSFTLHIEPTDPQEGVGLYRLFRSHFDSLWRASVSIDEWIQQSRANLPDDFPEIKPRQYPV